MEQHADKKEIMIETVSPDPAPVTDPHWAEELLQAESNIIEEIAAFIRRFVFFRDEGLYDLVAAWVVATYLTEVFDYVGYLFAHSPEPQSGKSRLLEVLDLLVHNSSGLLVSPTEAVLFRTAGGGTQLLDEVDSWRNKEELRSVLNAGFRLGGSVTRMREGKSDFEPVRFPVYGPRALAGIGTKILDITTRDRCFMLEMVRQKRGERRERLRPRKIEPEAKDLRGAIGRWVIANKESVRKLYTEFGFPYLEELRDRTIDIAQPIATIIEVAYAGSPDIGVARSKLMDAIALTREEERAVQDRHKVLRQLLQLADSEELVGTPTELSELCAKLLADAPPPDTISSTLRSYGFKTKSRRKGAAEPGYRYELPKAKLVEILERYGTEDLPEPETVADRPRVEVARPQMSDAEDVVTVVANTAGKDGQ